MNHGNPDQSGGSATVTTMDEAVAFLYSLRLAGMKLGLENTRALAARFNLPHPGHRFIHVAGTNGKGSVCAFLESALRHSGCRTGLFTSPHLVHFNERIRINGIPLPVPEIIRLTREIQQEIAAMQSASSTSPVHSIPTFFEAVTVMAIKAFHERQCDISIMETGLGGRLDATNIIRPALSIITSIGMDHQKWLGNTLEEIAGEKAGIIKPGVPVVCAPDHPGVAEVFRSKAAEVQAPLIMMTPQEAKDLAAGWDHPSIAGPHQELNLGLALKALEILSAPMRLDTHRLRDGIRATRWPARLQTVDAGDGRTFLLDGAHNPDGMRSLARFLTEKHPGRRFDFVLGFLSDRPLDQMIQPILPIASSITFCPVPTERGADPEELARSVRAITHDAIPVSSAENAVTAIKRRLGSGSTDLVAAGSLHFAGTILRDIGAEPFPVSDECSLPETTGLNEYSTSLNGAFRKASSSGSAAGNP